MNTLTTQTIDNLQVHRFIFLRYEAAIEFCKTVSLIRDIKLTVPSDEVLGTMASELKTAIGEIGDQIEGLPSVRKNHPELLDRDLKDLNALKDLFQGDLDYLSRLFTEA